MSDTEYKSNALAVADVENSNGYKMPFGIIKVELEYSDFDPMTFYFKRQLSGDLKTMKQNFYGKSEAEQAENLIDYQTQMLSQLLTKRPQGVDQFGYTDTGILAEDFVNFFSQEDYVPMLSDLWTLYQNKVYPKQFMLMPLE